MVRDVSEIVARLVLFYVIFLLRTLQASSDLSFLLTEILRRRYRRSRQFVLRKLGPARSKQKNECSHWSRR